MPINKFILWRPKIRKQCLVIPILILTLSFSMWHQTVEAKPYTSPRTLVLPPAQAAVASGDLNNDGFPDLILGGDPTPEIGLGKLYVCLGKGNGSFQPPQAYQVGYNSNDTFPAPFIQQIEIADMNDDGNLDVIILHNGDRNYLSNRSHVFITILFGNGSGSLQTSEGYIFNDASSTTLATSMDIADVTGDGLLDVVLSTVTGSNLGKIWILRNLGNGNFHTLGRIVLNANIWSVACAKLNNDQYWDFVMTTQVGVVIGYGEGSHFPTSFEQRDVNIVERDVIARDLNADGKMDFVVLANHESQIRVFLNSAAGFPELPVIYETDLIMTWLQIADVDGNGTLDLITSDRSIQTSDLHIFHGDGMGAFGPSEIVQNNFSISDAAFADFDLNGKIDIGVSLSEELGSTTPKAAVFLNAPNPSRYFTDFDGDLTSDLTIFRPGTGTWWSLRSSDLSFRAVAFGLSTDKVATGNYDGDHKADVAVYRDGVWFILNSSDNTFRVENWGVADDVPVQGDYENDGFTNPAVFRPSVGYWYLKKAEGFDSIQWGIGTDKPVPADFDGDGLFDIAVYRASEGTWYIRSTATGEFQIQQFGIAEDIPIPADYDGDGIADIAVFRPSTGFWYILQSSSGEVRYEIFGLSSDIPVPNDFDGDGRNDVGVYRPSDGTWYFVGSTTGTFSAVGWGTDQDVPIRPLH